MPIPSWTAGLISRVGRKQFHFLIKSHNTKIIALKNNNNKKQPNEQRANETLQKRPRSPPFAERLDLSVFS